MSEFLVTFKSNSRTSDYINMKPKTNKTTSQKIDDDVLSENYDFIINFQISDHIWPICKLDSTPFLLTVTFYIKRSENRTKTVLTQDSHY